MGLRLLRLLWICVLILGLIWVGLSLLEWALCLHFLNVLLKWPHVAREPVWFGQGTLWHIIGASGRTVYKVKWVTVQRGGKGSCVVGTVEVLLVLVLQYTGKRVEWSSPSVKERRMLKWLNHYLNFIKDPNSSYLFYFITSNTLFYLILLS